MEAGALDAHTSSFCHVKARRDPQMGHMTVLSVASTLRVAFGSILFCGLASPGFGADSRDQAEWLPFTRTFTVSGAVTGSFADATAAAGVPASPMLEALRAFITLGVDLERNPDDGDSFHVRYEQTFAIDGQPIGGGRVLSAELRSASTGTIALHRWRTPDGANRFWLANGKAPTLHSIDLPLTMVSVSSGFGTRADPFGRRWGMKAAEAPQRRGTGGPAPKGGWRPVLRVAPSAMMHNGVDFVAPSGTPVYAASDGVVLGARPNGGYGNWVQIDHPGSLSTVYGHLSGFAPGIRAGVPVSQGELIGFVGSTGRSTGPHLHFELLSDGAAVDPMVRREVGRAPLNGHDLERFKAQVARAEQERVAGD